MEMQMVLLASALAVLNGMGLEPEEKMAIQDRAKIEAASQAHAALCVVRVDSSSDRRNPDLQTAGLSQSLGNDLNRVHRCDATSQ